MATTTTNYGFDVPTSSDLVKNGATAISTLGQDLDTFLFRPFNKNAIINGAMEVWQRGTSFSATGYTADRWYSTGTNAITRSTTAPTGFNYSLNWVTAGAYPVVATYVELPVTGAKGNFTGNWVMSFYAKASTASTLSTDVAWADGSSRANLVAIATQGNSLTTSWQRFTVPVDFDISSPVGTSKAIEVNFYIASGGATINITGVQLEAGTQATPFTRAGGTIQGELAACQRYYYRKTASAAYSTLTTLAYATSTTEGWSPTELPVQFRVKPSAVEYSNLAFSTPGTGVTAISSATLTADSTVNCALIQLAATGLTAFRPYTISANNNSSAYLAFTAEL